MKNLYITRQNAHAKYYKKIILETTLNSELYIMGSLKILRWQSIKSAYNFDTKKIIKNQIKRKQAKNKLWLFPILTFLYSIFLFLLEKIRYAKYISLFLEKKPDNLIIWNGKKLPNITVVMAAKELKINIFFFENGLLPNTKTLDPKGVNASSSLSNDPEFYLNFDKDNSLSFSNPNIIARQEHKNRKHFDDDENLPQRFIFVAFQVPHDTQIICHSPWINSMEELYQKTIEAVESLEDPNLKIVFKEHPTWPKHYKSLYNKHNIAVFANGNKTVDLIRKAETVITINSTVGLEALLLNKPVITLGEACYNIEGLVQHANTKEDFLDCLNKIRNGWSPNLILRDKFFTYLENIYCIPGIKKDSKPTYIKAIDKRIQGTDIFSLHQK